MDPLETKNVNSDHVGKPQKYKKSYFLNGSAIKALPLFPLELNGSRTEELLQWAVGIFFLNKKKGF